MIECAVALALWWGAFGANDYLLSAAVIQTDALERRLVPLERMVDLAPLWLVEHSRSDWPRAFFTAAETASSAGRRLPVVSLGTRRLLPHVSGPRLFVHKSLFREGGLEFGFKPLESLAVDEAQHLFGGIFAAYFSHLLSTDPGVAQALARRADRLMTEAPVGYRTQAYSGALEDLAGHLLSIAHEVGRHRRRKTPEQLCALLDHPATLFGFWQRTLKSGAFSGLYPKSAETDRAGEPRGAVFLPARRREWVRTQAVLEPSDKAWLLKEVLGMARSGDPRRDFRFLCSSQAP